MGEKKRDTRDTNEYIRRVYIYADYAINVALKYMVRVETKGVVTEHNCYGSSWQLCHNGLFVTRNLWVFVCFGWCWEFRNPLLTLFKVWMILFVLSIDGFESILGAGHLLFRAIGEEKLAPLIELMLEFLIEVVSHFTGGSTSAPSGSSCSRSGRYTCPFFLRFSLRSRWSL